jgi:hypothetical protein
MTIEQFDLKILDLHWINNEDDPNDLCAHGHVYLKIGNEIVSDKESGDWTLSSTALSLMRTIDKDYKKNNNDNQLLPCCGHFIIADDQGENVTIQGCGNGIDWTIIHHSNGTVEHVTEKGEKGIITNEDYRKLISGFADKVEQFYKDSKSKTIPEDDFDKKGYLIFWKEWKRLRNKI